jgi:hypothetical protein
MSICKYLAEQTASGFFLGGLVEAGGFAMKWMSRLRGANVHNTLGWNKCPVL